MTSRSTSVFAAIGALVVGIPAIVGIAALSFIWRAYVLLVLWGWFLTPHFGWAVPSIPLTIGVTLMIYMVVHQHIPKDPTEGKWEAWFRAIVGPAMTLLCGWIVKQFL